jgi:hypothetical protein
MMFMFLLFMMFSPNPPNPYRLLALQELAGREQQSANALRNATWTNKFELPSSFNITGV